MGTNYQLYDKKKGVKAYNIGDIVKIKGKGGYRYAKIEMKTLRKGQKPFKGMSFISDPTEHAKPKSKK